MNPADPGSFNKYAYVLGDPVNNNDPSGLETADMFCDVYPNYWLCHSDFYNPMFLVKNGFGFLLGGAGGGASTQREQQIKTIQTSYARLRGLLGKDKDCTAFLSSRMDLPTYKKFMDALGPMIGPGPLPKGVNAQQGPIGSGYEITINPNGAFFNGRATIGYADTHAADMNRLQAGDTSGQIFILLHEIAHELKAVGFVEEGNQYGTDIKKEMSNNDLLWDKCSKTLNAAIPPIN